MKISQILNNNVALVNRGKNEVIIISKGIGFKKRKGQEIEEHEIEKTYILDSYDMLEHYSYLLSNSDANDIILVQEIVEYAQKELKIVASDYLSLTLLDHVSYLMKRVKKQQYIKSPLYWDVKRFYPKFYDVGMKALQMIETSLCLKIPEDEVVSIALHFINMQTNEHTNQEHIIVEMRAMKDIIAILQIHYKLKFDEQTTTFIRFTTHLQYFIERVMRYEMHDQDETSDALYQQVKILYPDAYTCVSKIKVYILSEFKVDMTRNEETYLMLHIHRVTKGGKHEI